MRSAFHDLRVQQKRLLYLIGRNFGPADRGKISAALAFAKRSHKGQRRDEGTPYAIHPIRVAITLLDEVGTWDADIIVAALLHDVIEDCRVRRAQVERRFGRRAANFVSALTRKRAARETEREKERRKIRKMMRLSRQALEIRLIKCADLLDNIQCAADIAFYLPAREQFPRWHREFHFAVKFARGSHPVLHRRIRAELRRFEMKRIARGVVRLGW